MAVSMVSWYVTVRCGAGALLLRFARTDIRCNALPGLDCAVGGVTVYLLRAHRVWSAGAHRCGLRLSSISWPHTSIVVALCLDCSSSWTFLEPAYGKVTENPVA